MWVGMLWALSLPGLVFLLVLAAAIERLCGVRMPWRRKGMPVSAAGFEELETMFSGGKRLELEDRKSQSLMRDDEEPGAPPHGRIDLDSGVARIAVPD